MPIVEMATVESKESKLRVLFLGPFLQLLELQIHFRVCPIFMEHNGPEN